MYHCFYIFCKLVFSFKLTKQTVNLNHHVHFKAFFPASVSLVVLDVKILCFSERLVQLHFIWKINILIVSFRNIKYIKRNTNVEV